MNPSEEPLPLPTSAPSSSPIRETSSFPSPEKPSEGLLSVSYPLPGDSTSGYPSMSPSPFPYYPSLEDPISTLPYAPSDSPSGDLSGFPTEIPKQG